MQDAEIFRHLGPIERWKMFLFAYKLVAGVPEKSPVKYVKMNKKYLQILIFLKQDNYLCRASKVVFECSS